MASNRTKLQAIRDLPWAAAMMVILKGTDIPGPSAEEPVLSSAND